MPLPSVASLSKMDEDTFNAIRALHDAFAFEYAADYDVGDSQQQQEEYHPPLESTYAYDAFAAVNHVVDLGGDYSNQGEQQDLPSMSMGSSTSNHGASSPSRDEIDNYRIGTSSMNLHRLYTMTQHSTIIAALLIMVVYPLIVTRLRSRWRVNRKARLILSEDLKEESQVTCCSCAQHDILLEKGFIDDAV